MDLNLKGKVVVVTGASRGIGLAIARAFAEEGARVVAGARNPGSDLAGLAASHDLVPVAADLATPAGVDRLVAAAVERHGAIDVLVNNVGTASLRLGGTASVTDQDWLDTFNLNLFSAVRATRAALPSLVAARGAVVTISSITAVMPEPGLVDYGASKSALANFSKALSKEVSPQGVRVNTVSLGPVSTDMLAAQADRLAQAMGLAPEAALRQYVDGAGGIATGRFTRADEVADLVLLLASERAGNITGADFTVDGGLVKTV
ncbi:MAG TPA: oxidoreductase [Micromonosporaceae bacterium]|nr:oxidoreductase [Micromonosporaceae bacterium]